MNAKFRICSLFLRAVTVTRVSCQYWELQWAVFLDVSPLCPESGVTGESGAEEYEQSEKPSVTRFANISTFNIIHCSPGLTASRARATLWRQTSSSFPMWTATTGYKPIVKLCLNSCSKGAFCRSVWTHWLSSARRNPTEPGSTTSSTAPRLQNNLFWRNILFFQRRYLSRFSHSVRFSGFSSSIQSI